MTIADIEKLAKLARIELTDAEKEMFAKDLEHILHYVDQIREVTTEDKPADVGDVYNILRADDNPRESGRYTETILAQAPATQDGFIKVKKIL
jgi:aspartyl-tRNA(Asn)/glutamyl-tRNA(Gln) amidotransferase subunit C